VIELESFLRDGSELVDGQNGPEEVILEVKTYLGSISYCDIGLHLSLAC
jgi:hypothetical protein